VWKGLLHPLQNWYLHWEQQKCIQPPLDRAYWNLQFGQAEGESEYRHENASEEEGK
jgi:hypothetical protein